MDVVREQALPVELDDGQPLAVPRLQIVVAGDIHLLQLEAELFSKSLELPLGTLAQVATGGGVEDEPGYG